MTTRRTARGSRSLRFDRMKSVSFSSFVLIFDIADDDRSRRIRDAGEGEEAVDGARHVSISQQRRESRRNSNPCSTSSRQRSEYPSKLSRLDRLVHHHRQRIVPAESRKQGDRQLLSSADSSTRISGRIAESVLLADGHALSAVLRHLRRSAHRQFGTRELVSGEVRRLGSNTSWTMECDVCLFSCHLFTRR